MNILTPLIWLLAGLISLSTTLGFLSRLDWRLELFSHFRLQYAAALGMCSALFLLIGVWPGFLFSLIGFLVNLALLLPIYPRRQSSSNPGAVYSIFFANIYGPNTQYDCIAAAIQRADPHVILLVEVRSHHLTALAPHLIDYPYRFTQPKQNNYGLAIFSRLPLNSIEIQDFNGLSLASLVARLSLDGASLTIIGTHPEAPKNRQHATNRVQHLEAVACFSAAQPGELLLLGDFNTTSWSHVFKDMLHTSHLLDSRQGFGLQPSWPVEYPLLRIPIDHALHTPGLCIRSRKLGPSIGSDHLPVILDITITKT